MNSSTAHSTTPIATQSVFSRPAALIGGAVGLVALTAIATTLAVRSPTPAADARAGTPTPLMALNAPANKGPAATPPEAPADFPEKMAPPAAAKPERSKSTAPAPQAAPKPAHAQRGTVQAPAAQVASVCSTCGKVESVAAVQQKGDGTGIGVVGGAVVGGLLGSQVGGGSGKNVATVLGAVGGGVAGNEVEKRARATTVYQVRVRMDDGSLRTLTQSSAPAVGQKVTVEGSTLRSRG
jgi:outer membrane lipoprotein SlyB